MTPTLSLEFDEPTMRWTRLYVRLPEQEVGEELKLASGPRGAVLDFANKWIADRGFSWDYGQMRRNIDHLQSLDCRGQLRWGVLVLPTVHRQN